MHEKQTIGNCTLYRGDCMEIMPELAPIDAVVTDPPYGCNYKTNRRRTLKTPEKLANDEKPNLAFVKPLVDIVKPNSAIYLCTRFDVYAVWEQALKDAGTNIKTTVVWDKGNWTAGDLKGDYGNQVELILFAHIGRPKLRQGRPGNLWSIPRDPPGPHPTPKPVELFKRCVLNSSDPGSVVLDPFMGGGTTGVACVQTGREFIGIELDKKYFDLACGRIEKAVKDQANIFPGVRVDAVKFEQRTFFGTT